MDKDLIISLLREYACKFPQEFHLFEINNQIELVSKTSRLGVEFEDEPSWWICRTDGYSNSGCDIYLETVKSQIELL